MKLNGVKVEGPNVEILVIPRGGDKPDLVFQAQAILDDSPFSELCPVPVPPIKIVKGGAQEKDFNNPTFKAQVDIYNDKRNAWMVVTSLSATPGLEWETVSANDHNSWSNWKQELKDAGLSYIEVQRVENLVYTANCLNEFRVEEARKSFLLGLAAPSNG